MRLVATPRLPGRPEARLGLVEAEEEEEVGVLLCGNGLLAAEPLGLLRVLAADGLEAAAAAALLAAVFLRLLTVGWR